MKTTWTKGMTPEQVAEFKREYATSGVVRDRLTNLLKEKIKVSNVNLRNKDNYEKSSWSFLQADGIGYERALNEIISLISSVSVEKS